MRAARAPLALLAALLRCRGAGAAFLRGGSAAGGQPLALGTTPLRRLCGRFEAAWAQNQSGACRASGQPEADLCQEDPAFCSGNLGLERCELPQTPQDEERFRLWVAAAAARGVGIEEAQLPAGRVARLLPSQTTLDACKVCAMAFAADACLGRDGVPSEQDCEGSGCFCVWASGISVAQGGRVLDGHHRWAAAKVLVESGRLPEAAPVRVELYNASVEEVSKAANECGDLVGHSECAGRLAA
mmetsp:Transcript_96442/g.251388  ORF Transcript_96442/g.251388 Transcript_96442/m.251388 type:complete len:243 (-) Transcript_96442:28-756(-)